LMIKAVSNMSGAKKINAVAAITTSRIRVVSNGNSVFGASDFNAIGISFIPRSKAAERRASRTSLEPNWYKTAPPSEQLCYLKQYACQAKFHFALQHGFGAAGATLVSGEYSVSENRAGGPPRPGGEAQDEAPPPGARAANHPSPSPFPAGAWRRAGVCVWAAAVAFTGVVAVRE